MAQVRAEVPDGNAGQPLDKDLRAYLETNADIVTRITKQVNIDDIGALASQSEGPIVFDNIKEHPGFSVCDMMVKHRWSQCRALGVSADEYLPTLAQRLRKPPRGFVNVATGPVKDVVYTGDEVDWMKLPASLHSEHEDDPYMSPINIIKDPETGFYNSCNAGTTPVGPRRGLMSFVTPHSHVIMRKYCEMGIDDMPIALVFGAPPAFEIMAQFSGLHMDLWGEMEMVGTIMDMDVEVVPCETIDLNVPAHAEIVVEGTVNLKEMFDYGGSVGPSTYFMPRAQKLPEVQLSAMTMRSGQPIYRRHQTTADSDHQVLPRLIHEAITYNRITEIGIKVKDVRFPTWGAAVSCLIQIEAPREGFVNDALMQTMGAPWLNTKMVVALSPDTDLDSPGDVYHAIATRCDPSRDIIIVDNTRGSLYDPSARPIEGDAPWRVVGKIGIDATRKDRHEAADFERAWPKNWGKVDLKDYL